ncbi:peptidylprolyl isomerase [Paenibacillus assamensis]|uniref:peptidylprolyl isomerase n=1 Tax=Paenibacillus assamensis TaxID=311244 RepID=UPI0004059F3B|nr:peptidylprolyl isomerase [Paenibacillus assamensis]
MSQNNAKRSWKGMLMTLTLVFALVVTGCGAGSENNAGETKEGTKTEAKKDTSKVVATYEGGQLTENEFNKEIAIRSIFDPQSAQLLQIEQFREHFAKETIAYKYLAEKATDKAKDEGKKKANEQIDAIKKQLGDEQFKKMLEAQKVTEAEMRDFTTRILTVVADMNQKVTDEQLKAEFEKVKNEMTTASVRHILVQFKPEGGKERTKEEALKIAKGYEARLKKGEDFAKLAGEVSEDGGSKANGGLYADAQVGQWVPAFKEAALTLKINEISAPVETEYGYHVMRVEKRTEKQFDKLTEEEMNMVRATAATQYMDKFMKDELPKLIKKMELPPVPQPETPKAEEPKTEQPKTEQPADNKEADKPAAGSEADKPAEEADKK